MFLEYGESAKLLPTMKALDIFIRHVLCTARLVTRCNKDRNRGRADKYFYLHCSRNGRGNYHLYNRAQQMSAKFMFQLYMTLSVIEIKARDKCAILMLHNYVKLMLPR